MANRTKHGIYSIILWQDCEIFYHFSEDWRIKMYYRACTLPYGAGFSYGKRHVFIVINKNYDSQFIESHVSHMKIPAIWECASSVLSFYTLVHVINAGINGTCIERWLTMELLEIVTECLKWRHVVKKKHRWNLDGVEIITEEFGEMHLNTEEFGKKRMVIVNFWFCLKNVDSSGVSWHYCM